MRMRSWAVSLVVLCVALTALTLAQRGVTNGEWPHWGGDLGNTKYSPLDQINRDNVKDLRIAWRWKSENYGPRPQNNMEGTPLMVGGVLYATAGFRPERRRHRRRDRRDAVELQIRRRGSAAIALRAACRAASRTGPTASSRESS